MIGEAAGGLKRTKKESIKLIGEIADEKIEISKTGEKEYQLKMHLSTLESGISIGVFFYVQDHTNLYDTHFTSKLVATGKDSWSEERELTSKLSKEEVSFRTKNVALDQPKYLRSEIEVKDGKVVEYPLVIRLNGKEQSILYYFTLKLSEGAVVASLLYSKVQIEDEVWVRRRIFGTDDGQDKNLRIETLTTARKDCVICFTQKIDIVIMGCKHLAICSKCANTIKENKKNRECPVCRMKIDRFVRIVAN